MAVPHVMIDHVELEKTFELFPSVCTCASIMYIHMPYKTEGALFQL